jgi:glycerophosphoryl diester phosphodiesterase
MALLFSRFATAFCVRLLIVMLALTVSGAADTFDLQGHRGARGLAPENTLEGFARAVEIGVTTLETDIAVTKDGVLVLYHDRVLNPDITRQADGTWLSARGPAINSLTNAELGRYDVGRIKPESKYAAQFPEQRAVDGARIPTLADLFAVASPSGRAPRFNIETKLSPDHPGETPDPETFARLVVESVRKAGVSARVTIQSFDWRTLQAARKLAPGLGTVCLTVQATLRDRQVDRLRKPSPWLAGLDPVDYGGSVPRLVQAAGCGTWSPLYAELTADAVAEAHKLDLKVVPWTINARDDMERVIDMGVDGLITDYPDRARAVMAAKGLPLP